MRSLYETVDRFKRAQQHRTDAIECERKGFPMFASHNWEMAAMLDPYREDEEQESA